MEKTIAALALFSLDLVCSARQGLRPVACRLQVSDLRIKFMYKIKQVKDLFTPRDGSKTLASGWFHAPDTKECNE
jgi:hypothetical protein